MFKSINLNKITKTSCLAILLAGTLIGQPAISVSSNSGSGNNSGHGNNCDGIDSSNPGLGSPDGKNKNHNETDPNVDDEGKGNCSTTSSSTDSSINSQPIGISKLYTENESATVTNSKIYDKNNNASSMKFGAGNNKRLTGFQVGNQDYSILQLVDEARLQRVDNALTSGEKHVFFLEANSNNSEVKSSFIETMEQAVRSEFINIGSDNVFANAKEGNGNHNNIERVDFLIDDGFTVNENYLSNAGFLLLERGGNDPFKIAAITAVDADGNPSAFGELLSVPKSTWGNSGIKMNTSVFQTEPQWIEPKFTATPNGQKIHGVFVSIASLGITADQKIYGYAVFPNDVNANNDLVGLSDFPTNTGSSSGEGGLDLISSGGLFIPEGNTVTEVFKKSPKPLMASSKKPHYAD